jgi:hypothetical protein
MTNSDKRDDLVSVNVNAKLLEFVEMLSSFLDSLCDLYTVLAKESGVISRNSIPRHRREQQLPPKSFRLSQGI